MYSFFSATQLSAPFLPPPLYHVPAGLGFHAFEKAVLAGTLALLGLIRPFRHNLLLFFVNLSRITRMVTQTADCMYFSVQFGDRIPAFVQGVFVGFPMA